MDIQPLKQEIEGLIAQVTDAQKQADLRARLGDLVARHAAAADDAARQPIETELATLRDEAKAAGPAQSPSQAPPFLTKGGFILVILLILLSFGFLFYFVERMVRRELSAIESVQFLIVLTLILSMLAFGGLLIIRAMFAPYGGEELQNRFRMGREVFLVFSGVFGTIIGFYFGSEDEDTDAGAPSVEIAFADERVTAAVAGGHEPFTAIYTEPGEPGGRVMEADERVHSIEVGQACPDGAEVVVIDGRGRRADATLDCDGGEGPDDGQTGNNVTNSNDTTGNSQSPPPTKQGQ